MSTTVDGLQLRDNHSFLHHRTKHLSKYHNGHVKNLVRELHREDERMHCGYLSLRHNWNIKSLRRKCWNSSLMVTGTSTAASRKSTSRKLFLPLLLPLPPPRLGGARGQRLCTDLGDPALLLRRPESRRHSEQLHLFLRTPPQLLLLPSLQQRALEEKGDQWAVVHLTNAEVQQRRWLRSDL